MCLWLMDSLPRAQNSALTARDGESGQIRKALEGRVRIRADDTDYKCLGEQLTQAECGKLIELLRRTKCNT